MKIPYCARATNTDGADFWASRGTYLKIGEEVAFAMAVYKIVTRTTVSKRRYLFHGELVRDLSMKEWMVLCTGS